ncbi:MAG: hypothetical protein KDE68_12490 [Rhodocyclaceae bacterium]|nr:hypothetical protein [Rhodocyclaceae bacterium]
MKIQLTLIAALFAAASGTARAAAEPTVIELNQTGCQFVESENGVDHGYAPATAADCKAINAKTGDARLTGSKVLELKPGKYIFRVANKNVPYELGFWLRGAGLSGRALLPSVSGGGLSTGVSRDYAIELKAGEYLYSCPLNPTPDYKLVVK